MIEDLINRNLSREVTFYWGGRCPADLYMADLARNGNPGNDGFDLSRCCPNLIRRGRADWARP